MDGKMIWIPLVAGYVLDLLLGDPRHLPHPVRLFGNMIEYGEQRLNKGTYRLLKGAIMTIVLCLGVYAFFYSMQVILPVWARYIFNTIFVFYGLANKSLLEEGKAVYDTLYNQGLEAGRKRLSWIVGRDTSKLQENQIRVAVLETLSENLSDGVIAPLCFYAVGGVPAMMLYKMINTLDSMIGYKHARYLFFGRFAARLDDVANYIPARLTALLMVMVTGSLRGWRYILKFGHQHASPNSGYPEAALAGILNCRFGGPNVYHGVLVEKPYIGEQQREIRHEELRKVMFINHAVTFVVVALIVVLHYNNS
ncbi:adenosylcobinamide-phosphate synthase CbiB [Chitinophaga sancti]|uniref:Cobalamin biosynthesis protein CobD n=1 Tax=Chitinophaga sancti TaxID=1004 RepID=A0A1K1NK84_9BACT|nr:adenosylcobinamide-phosphate synthase CbiB [Chitinophaga sancti]WQD63216.1 adenosylcobinamide-phosphate synthase CbiB [Chitinophaga sancti]WQG91158.1 adenosylcobinamide-phosphate synthase CbiB [Chitinophaga sancti]SFW34838.1 adenosylcobinamide-phosphate synthase [Chitinophaga sancti]